MAKDARSSKITDAVSVMAGGVLTNVVTGFIPVENQTIKAAIPVIAGFFLSRQKGMIGKAGEGMMAVGAANLAKGFGIGEVDDLSLVGQVADDEMNGVDEAFVAGIDMDEN